MNLARSVFCLGPVLASVIWAGPAPLRLRITAQPGTLHPGERARIDVQFLDREYKPVANDVPRTIQFTVQPLDSGAAGVVTAPTTAPAGTSRWNEVWFRCSTPGRLQISAASAGLMPANTIVVGIPARMSRLDEWLFPRVLADSNPTISILPKEIGTIPANGLTPASFKFILDRPVGPGEQVSVLLTTSSESQITYNGTVTMTSLWIPIKEGSATSDDIRVSSSSPANMDVFARLSPGGSTDKLVLRFVPPSPIKVIMDPPSLRFMRHQPEMEVFVGIADQDHVPIRLLTAPHPIELGSLDDPRHKLISVSPSTLSLVPNNPRRSVRVRVNAYPPNGQLYLQARDSDRDLDPCLTAISVENPAQKLGFLGPRQARTSDRELQLVVSLLDDGGKNVSADWDTLVQLHSDQLSPRDQAVTVKKGKFNATAKYTLPGSSGRAIVSGIVDSAPSELNVYSLAIVTALYALVLIAFLGGSLGAFAKQLKGRGIGEVLPRREHGHLNPGLLGNLAAGGLFGIVVFLAFELGLLRSLGMWAIISSSLGDSSVQAGPLAAAFLVGFLGGYAGHSLIDRLLELPKPSQPGQAVSTPSLLSR